MGVEAAWGVVMWEDVVEVECVVWWNGVVERSHPLYSISTKRYIPKGECLSVCLSVYLSICLSIYLPICLSLY